MVTIPNTPIPGTPPEPLTIVTALSSVKAINKIFYDQIGFYKTIQFEPIIVSSPFYMLDSDSFKKDIFSRDEKRPLIINQVKAIHDYAAGNIKTYEDRIRDREITGKFEKYYTIHPEGALSANGFPEATRVILHPDNKHRQDFMFLFSFYHFCQEVHKITSDFLAESLEPKQPTFQVKPEPQAKDKVKYHAAKWYALHHLICMKTGKTVPMFESGARKEIEEYAQNRYFKDRENGKGKEGFYRALINLDLNKLSVHIKDFQKDRPNWKEIITLISDNDADIVLWLSHQPK